MNEPMSIPEQVTDFSFCSAFPLGAVISGDGKADPSVLAVFQDYIKLMPLVAEANQMSEELGKARARIGMSSPERTLGNRFHTPHSHCLKLASWYRRGHRGLGRGGALPKTPQ